MFHSDHLGVSSNHNALADHCSPLLPSSAKDLYGSEQVGARVLTEAELGINPGGSNNPNDNGDPLPGVLEHPGSVQWYYLEWDGAYLIGFDQASYDLGYEVQVYSADNLSRPVKAYGAREYEQVVGTRPPVTVYGKKYVVQGGPFYIKVYHPTHQHLDLPGNASGSYVLGIDALGCTDKYNDACPIFPNMNYAFEMPSGTFDSSPEKDSMYFDLAVERPTKPAEQRVVFDVFNYPANTLESALVYNDPTTDIVRTNGGIPLEMAGVTNQGTSSAACNCSLSIDTDVPSPVDPSQRMVWRVRRGHGTGAVTFTVVWSTELTVAFGGGIWDELDQMNLVCSETTSDSGNHDEIDTEVWVDGIHMSGGPGNAHRHDVGRFGDGEHRSMDQINAWLRSPWRFKSEVRWRRHETDTGGSSNQVDFEVGTIDIFETGPFSAAVKDFVDVYFDDGHYSTEVASNHGLQSYSAP